MVLRYKIFTQFLLLFLVERIWLANGGGLQGYTDLSSSTSCAQGQAIRACTSFEGMHGGLSLQPSDSSNAVFPCYCPHYGPSNKTYTLVMTKNSIPNILVPGQTRTVVQLNGTVPAPIINVTEYDWIVATVINNVPDEPTTIHWHGMIQQGTQYSDGVHALTQCLIQPGAQVTYRFRATLSGTFWYHSHYSMQYPNGVYGALIINRLFPGGKTEAQYYGYSNDFVLLIQDFYNNYAETVLNEYYLTPISGGAEPIPDAIVVNGKLSAGLSDVARSLLYIQTVDRTSKSRFRFIAANALSMYNVSIDGVKMLVIETDGTTVHPLPVSYFLLNPGQRVSVLVDWNNVPVAIKSIYVRVTAVAAMYATNITDYVPYYDVPGAQPLDPNWLGIVQFQNRPLQMPNYNGVLSGPRAPPPSDSNLIETKPLDVKIAPAPTHYMYTEIDFFTPATNVLGSPNGAELLAGVNYASFNNISSMPQNAVPTLFSYLTDSVPTGTKFDISSAAQSQLPATVGKLKSIYYNRNGQYSLPYQAVVENVIYNTDTGDHPIHKHTHPFWVVSSSEYPEAEQDNAGNYPRRDVVTVQCCGGWVKLRYIADIPGIWAQHCHIDWHLAAGLFMTVVEAPEILEASGTQIPSDFRALCTA